MSNDTPVQATSRTEPQQRGDQRQADARAMLPRVDVFEDDTGITLLADLPGEPRYRRVFTLSRELDPGRIEANLKDGVLNLRIPKQEHAQPRRIQVQVG